MKRIVLLLVTFALARSYPQLYQTNFGYNLPIYNPFRPYVPPVRTYSPFVPTYPTPDILPTLNVLAETPSAMSNKFTVVPMLVVSEENVNVVSNGNIAKILKNQPLMVIKTERNDFLQCTPAVRIVLEKPMVVNSLETSVLFPTEVEIVHGGLRIPINVGAVVAPISKNTFVSIPSPVALKVVYAIPIGPINVNFDYVNNEDAVFNPDTEAVVVETEPDDLPPKNVTIINFPDEEAEPEPQNNGEDDELVNRNPPQVSAPAGIVQSTQPQTVVEPFSNSKESVNLLALREEAKKRI